jgi:hypothetical protein
MYAPSQHGDVKMRQTLVAAATAFVIGGIATGAMLSHAQPAPPPMQQTDAAAPPPHGWMAMGHRHGHGSPFRPRDFALIYRQPDRQLAPADVQKIAEAFLLWNGNHTWKVTNVAATPDGPVGFSLTTPEGSIVAKFTMDPHTGRISRVG